MPMQWLTIVGVCSAPSTMTVFTTDIGSQTGEGRNIDIANTLWPKMGHRGLDVTDGGTIYYQIAP